jgi:hypothetical protein
MNRHEASSAYGELAEGIDEVVGEYQQLAVEAYAAREATEAERALVAKALAGAYLPALTPEALADAARWTGFQRFSRRDPIAAMAHEEVRLRHDLATIEGSEAYRRRDALVGLGGELVRNVEEAREFLAPWVVECERFEHLEGFLELVEIRYDTPEFAERWWQQSYWRHWSAGDKICEALDMADFGDDVLPAYARVREPRDQWLAAVATAEGRVNALHELVRRRDGIVERLLHLGEIYLDECHDQLAAHLVHADPAMLELWARGEPPLSETTRREVVLHLQRLSGLAAKFDAYGQMGAAWVPAQIRALEDTGARFRMKSEKYARPSRKLEVGDVPLEWNDKLLRHKERVQKARGSVDRLRRFDDYDRFDLSNDPALWWLLFADHHAPPVFYPGYRAWYERNPGCSVILSGEEPVLSAHHHHAAMGDVS